MMVKGVVAVDEPSALDTVIENEYVPGVVGTPLIVLPDRVMPIGVAPPVTE